MRSSSSGPGDGTPPITSSPDRKSTRLNSSHRCSSYAVFCLKKKKVDSSFMYGGALMPTALDFNRDAVREFRRSVALDHPDHSTPKQNVATIITAPAKHLHNS